MSTPTPLLEPPAEVLAHVDAAWERASALARAGYGMHFGADECGRVTIELRTAGGETLRTLTPCQALDVAHRPYE